MLGISYCFLIQLPVEMGLMQCPGKSILGTTHGRMGWDGKIYWSWHLVSSVPRWLSSVPTVEEVQLCLHQAQRTGQGPEILCQWARHSSVQSRLRQSLVQLRLRPHPASLVSVPACALASATLLYPGPQWGPSLEPVLGWTLVAARAAWLLQGENVQTKEQTQEWACAAKEDLS